MRIFMKNLKKILIGSLILLGSISGAEKEKTTFPLEDHNSISLSRVEITESEKEIAVPEKLNNVRGSVYDISTYRFIEKEGGLAESVMNKYDPLIYKSDIWLYRAIDSIEANARFVKKEDLEGGLSELSMFVNMIKNFELLSLIDTIPLEDLREEYVNTKKVMLALDSIHNLKNLNPYQKASKTFDEIYKRINLKNRDDDLLIHQMLNGKGGDCSDVTSTFYPLFVYYGFNAGFVSGRILGDSGRYNIHIWPHIKLGSFNFDFDPSWYPIFSPLETRLEEEGFKSLKDKFEVKKYNSPNSD